MAAIGVTTLELLHGNTDIFFVLNYFFEVESVKELLNSLFVFFSLATVAWCMLLCTHCDATLLASMVLHLFSLVFILLPSTFNFLHDFRQFSLPLSAE